MEKIVALIPLLPLAGFIINGLFGKNLGKQAVGYIGAGSVFISFLLTCVLFFKIHDEPVHSHVFTWISFGDFNINISFLADNLSVWMMMIITGIGFLIHVYSIGYMHDDDGFHKFFAYLNLFIFSMLLLVMGSNYVMLFFGWEGVGLCSYLLIGFWYDNKEYGKAARKAFIMNRIGDLGLLIGLFLIYTNFGTFEYNEILDSGRINTIPQDTMNLITLCLFIGAMGKSAQIPLYTWLPDAMAGPTPVSALIHAATMVTAGIYLVVRSNFLYEAAPDTMNIILVIGMLTSVGAALIGLRQNDIKKVLAYSTVSQLGFMFVALGVGSYTAAMFHLTTHAFFKALLFLGSGSVIHAMGGEQDIRKMGGLKEKLPVTHITFLIGTLAIIGFPLMSGFVSKDEILAHCYQYSPIVWIIGAGSAALTGIYMLRMYFLTFHGKFRGTHDQEHHLHESPSSMTIPLIVLAALSLLGGALNMPGLLLHNTKQWLAHHITENTDGMSMVGHGKPLDHSTEWALMFAAIAIVGLVIYFSWNAYIKKGSLAKEDAKLTGWEKWSANKFYVDELYDKLIVKPLAWSSTQLHTMVDNKFVDGAVKLVGSTVTGGSKLLSYLQSGRIENYFVGMVTGIILILLYCFYI